MSEEKVAIFQKMRRVTEMTGEVYDAQVTTLKKVGTMLFGHPLTITVTPNEIDLNSTVKQIQGVVIFYVQCRPDPKKEDAIRVLVPEILGRGWTVKVTYDEYVDPSGATDGNQSVAHRKQRPRRVPAKRKARAKPKNRR